MHGQRPTQAFAALAIVIFGCTPSSSRLPSPMPSVPVQPADTGPAGNVRSLRFSSGHFQYDLVQTTRIFPEESRDTASSGITTAALLSVDISTESDSSYDVIASVDSLQIAASGAIPPGPIRGPTSLGPILHASFKSTYSTIETRLPDSLCAYSQFVSAARGVLLPQLPSHIAIPLTQVWTDTTSITSCRAGARIAMLTTRQITDLGKEPPQFSLQEKTEIRGTGILRQDSVTVSGSISTQGAIFFTGNSRVPTSVQSQSVGSITVRLRDSTTVFRQNSTLQIQLRGSP